MTTVNLSDDIVNSAKKYAAVYHRSVPKQIEFWSKIGRIAEKNSDLPYTFIRDILLAMEEESIPFTLDELKNEIESDHHAADSSGTIADV